MNLKRYESGDLFRDFTKAVSCACSMSYLKDIYITQQQLKKIEPSVKQLDDIIELINIDKNNNSQSLWSSVLLIELAYLEYYIKEVKEFYILEEGKDTNTKLYLCSKKDNQMQVILTDHLFAKRRSIEERTNVYELSEYSKIAKEPDRGWMQVHKSDAIIVSSAMLLHYKLSLEDIKLYFELKIIRNTEIAHLNGDINASKRNTTDMIPKIKKLYHDVISKIILSKP